VDAFRLSTDAGGSWSDWISLDLGPVTEVEREGLGEGLVSAVVVVRDRSGNESDEFPFTFFLVPEEPMSLGAGAKFAGKVVAAGDVDALELNLVKGDVLSVKLKAKSSVKGDPLDMLLDLVDSDGTKVVKGKFPTSSQKVEIKSFPVKETGRYLLVALLNASTRSTKGTYKLAAKVKQAKENKKVKDETTGTEVAFDAVEGTILKGSLKGDGLTLAAVTLVGPDGPVAFTGKEGKGKVSIGSTVLDAGTGTYRFQFTSALTVGSSLKLKLPKIKGTVTE
jgi:hypothetical protein